MKIIFDGRWLGRTGIGRYAGELLRELQEIDRTNEYLVLLLPKQYEQWNPTAPNFSAILTKYDVYSWQEQLLLGRQIAALAPDLVHFTSFNSPIFYSGRFVTTIHDLTLVHYKNPRGTGLKRGLYELKYQAMLGILKRVTQRATAILVPTRYVQDDLAHHYGATVGKTTVTLEAVKPELATPSEITRFEVPERFVMYVGNYYPYKNIGRLVEAFAISRSRAAGVKLILCGPPSYFQDVIVKQVVRGGLADSVIFAGFTPDSELATLYAKAQAYVFPSLCEGFGLPGLEAMRYGTPVVAANASCLPEVLGDAAVYFDPLHAADIAEKIDVLLEDEHQMQRLREAGPVHAKLFSWRQMAEETLEVYKSTELKR